MAGRRTNLALLVLVPVAALTGGVAFATGAGWARPAALAHAAAGFAVVVLAPWKSAVVNRGVRRRRRGRWLSVAFGALVAVAVVTGVAHSTGLARSLGPVGSLWVHVATALAAIPLYAAHVVARPQRIRRVDLDRRAAGRLAAVGTAAVTVTAASEVAVRALGLPGADRRGTGSYERGSFEPAAMPVTAWLNDRVPAVDQESWRLSAPGRDWTLAELDRLAPVDQRAVLDCTSGWWSEQDWAGVPVSLLVGDAGGRSIVVRSVTGYSRRFPRGDADHLLVATRLGGRPLSPGHGAPARIVAPGRRGFWWVKWVDRIETSDRPWWLDSPFPLT